MPNTYEIYLLIQDPSSYQMKNNMYETDGSELGFVLRDLSLGIIAEIY